MGITQPLLSFALVALALTVTPGLDTALVLRTAARDGRRAALGVAVGIGAGVVVWATAAAVGVSAVLAASPLAFTLLRLAGAGYMIALGARMLWSALRRPVDPAHPEDDPDASRSPRPGERLRHLRTGLLVNLLNPKVGVFYLALIPQFLSPAAPPVVMGVLLGVVHAAETLAWSALLAALVDRAGAVLRRPSARRWIDGVVGIVVLGFGAALLASTP